MQKVNAQKIQQNYMLARVYYSTIQSKLDDVEKECVSGLKIINPDGTKPTDLNDIENQNNFDDACKAVQEQFDKTGLQKEINEARELLKKAKDQLFELGIYLAPFDIREKLQKSAKENFMIYDKIIDLISKTDLSTFPSKQWY